MKYLPHVHEFIAIHRVPITTSHMKFHFERVTHCCVSLRQGPADGVHLTHGDQSGGLLPLLSDPEA